MNTYQVHCAGRDSGKETIERITAWTPEEATRIANANGFVVGKIRQLSKEPEHENPDIIKLATNASDIERAVYRAMLKIENRRSKRAAVGFVLVAVAAVGVYILPKVSEDQSTKTEMWIQRLEQRSRMSLDQKINEFLDREAELHAK